MVRYNSTGVTIRSMRSSTSNVVEVARWSIPWQGDPLLLSTSWPWNESCQTGSLSCISWSSRIVCVWVLSARVPSHRAPLTAGQLSRLVAAHRAALEVRASVDVVRRAAARLSTARVAADSIHRSRSRPRLHPGWNPARGGLRSSLEPETKRSSSSYVLGLAPSGTVWCRPPRRAGTVTPWTCAPLVDDPRVDRRRWAGLPNLPGAEEEAKVVAALYGKAHSLLAARPRGGFSPGRAASTVVHFAAMPRAARMPLRWLGSCSLLIRSRGASDASTSRDLARARVERTRVVVLAACRTARSRLARVEGALGLAGPFSPPSSERRPPACGRSTTRQSSLLPRLSSRSHCPRRASPGVAPAQMTLLRSQAPTWPAPMPGPPFVHIGGTARHSFSKGDAS